MIGTALVHRYQPRTLFRLEIFNRFTSRRLMRFWEVIRKHYGSKDSAPPKYKAPLRNMSWWPQTSGGSDGRGAIVPSEHEQGGKGDNMKLLAEIAEIMFERPAKTYLTSDHYSDPEAVLAWSWTVLLMGWGFKIGSKHLIENKWAALSLCWHQLAKDTLTVYSKPESQRLDLQEITEGAYIDLHVKWTNFQNPGFCSPTLKNKTYRNNSHLWPLVTKTLENMILWLIQVLSHDENHTGLGLP